MNKKEENEMLMLISISKRNGYRKALIDVLDLSYMDDDGNIIITQKNLKKLERMK